MVIFLLTLGGFYALTSTNGPPAGNTNAPGDANCTQCHSGTLVTSGTNWNNISLSSNIPSTGYLPDSVYTLTLSHSQSGISKFGFQITALKSSGNTKTGTFIITNTTTTKLLSGTRDYVEQTSAGTSGSGSISWSFNWKAPATNSGDVVFYAAINASNNNGGSSGDMILAKTFTYQVSSLLPTAVINVSDSTVCVDDTVFLYGSGNNSPGSWSWVMKGGTPATSSTQNASVVYKTAGTFTITLLTTNSKGASLLATQKIYVTAKPTVSITPAGPVNICQGDSVALNAVAGKSMTYIWNTSQTTAIIYVKTSGTYYCTVTNSSGCSQTSKPVTVVVHSLPSVSLTSNPNDTICKGTAVVFTANPSNFKNYTFITGKAILQNSANNTFTTSTLTNGTAIYVSIKDSNNCPAASDTITTTVINPLDTPKVSCGTATTSTAEFVWPADTSALEYEVSEDSGKTWISPGSGANGLSHEVYGLTYNQSYMLFVRAKDQFPCFYSPAGSHTCTSLPCSPISYRFEYDSVLCKGQSTSIDLHDINTSRYAVDFENQGFSKNTVYPVTPDSSTTYTMLLIDSNALNCPALIFKAHVRVSPLPVVNLTSDKKNNSLCRGDSILLSAIKGYPKYMFIRNTTDSIQNFKSNIYMPETLSDGDRYTAVAYNQDGCQASSKELKIKVFELPVCDFSFVQNYLQFSFTDKTPHAASWKWDFGDSGLDTVRLPIHIYTAPGLYYVKLAVVDSNGCSDDTIRKVNAVINNIDEKSAAAFSVSYNRSDMMIEVKYEQGSPAMVSVILLHQSGVVLQSTRPVFQKQGRYNISFPAGDLKKGLYFIRLNIGSRILSKKIIID